MGARNKLKELRLPKRSEIERFVKQRPTCGMEMLSFLNCLKANQFQDSACVRERMALEECVREHQSSTGSGSGRKRKDTLMYHLKRLYYLQRR
ncbi:hypothetical protein CDCA_CDCA01G0447 [Cyanidium caldarium]|uniref:IMS import disulfide relay-system CHCH-CHCH-like Cx9C domain-containing protein n=1 Tax=Cyanidium caldarium TaxID=2771 RepID=A0AAV9IQ79_CYACA|nr:hypothetical protein CDCA_CDCA01G0447 [Cyanidium caldarium]